jgi:hypothetical protein
MDSRAGVSVAGLFLFAVVVEVDFGIEDCFLTGTPLEKERDTKRKRGKVLMIREEERRDRKRRNQHDGRAENCAVSELAGERLTKKTAVKVERHLRRRGVAVPTNTELRRRRARAEKGRTREGEKRRERREKDKSVTRGKSKSR